MIICDNSAQDIIAGSRINTRNRFIQNVELGMPAHNQYKLYLFPASL